MFVTNYNLLYSNTALVDFLGTLLDSDVCTSKHKSSASSLLAWLVIHCSRQINSPSNDTV